MRALLNFKRRRVLAFEGYDVETVPTGYDALERMQVDLSVRVKGTEAQQALLTASESKTASFKVTIGGQGRQGESRDPDEVQIRMQFQASEPPEALNRLIDEYTNLIVPVRALDPQPFLDLANFGVDAPARSRVTVIAPVDIASDEPFAPLASDDMVMAGGRAWKVRTGR